MSIYLRLRPLPTSVQIQRNDPLFLNKLKGEVGLEKIKTVFGWEINTRKHMLSLLHNKTLKYKQLIHKIFDNRGSTSADIQYLTGKPITITHILPTRRHFSGYLHCCANTTSSYQHFVLTTNQRKDLILQLTLLDVASHGISINDIVYQAVYMEAKTDACEHGIGGFAS